MAPGRFPCSLDEHRAMLAAVAAADPGAAEREMRLHLGNVIEALRQAISRRLHLSNG